MIRPDMRLDRRFRRNATGLIEGYSFQVGILKDGPYLKPQKGERGKKGRDVLSNFAGGPVRKKSSRESGLNLTEVSKELRENVGVNYFTKPFQRKNTDIMIFMRRFFQVIKGQSQPKRLENSLQAIVRNPILRGEYGSNSDLTKKIKGFDRHMIDTGQVFKSIIARVRRRSSRV